MARAKELVSRMTLAEQISLCQGKKTNLTDLEKQYIGVVVGIPRLGVPDLLMNDGPQGFRTKAHPGTSTQWPSGLTVAHSWDPELIRSWGLQWAANSTGREPTYSLDRL